MTLLPNLSWMLNVSELRYIQSRCEAADYRNPDSLAGAFLPLARRWVSLIRGKYLRSRLRSNPFYPYLLARTRYYDGVYLDAVRGGVACIVNIGCGGDTRAYRFAPLLRERGVRVLECDQPRAIAAKQKIAGERWPTGHVRYLALDLHESGWGSLPRALEEYRAAPVLVMLEGVSPYVASASFEAFLRFLAERLDARSTLAYDFKIAGTPDQAPSPVPQPFRLPAQRGTVAAYHAALGLRLEHMELSSELARRLAPEAPARYEMDCLLRLSPA